MARAQTHLAEATISVHDHGCTPSTCLLRACLYYTGMPFGQCDVFVVVKRTFNLLVKKSNENRAAFDCFAITALQLCGSAHPTCTCVSKEGPKKSMTNAPRVLGRGEAKLRTPRIHGVKYRKRKRIKKHHQLSSFCCFLSPLAFDSNMHCVFSGYKSRCRHIIDNDCGHPAEHSVEEREKERKKSRKNEKQIEGRQKNGQKKNNLQI